MCLPGKLLKWMIVVSTDEHVERHFRDLSVTAAQFIRNDRFQDDVILRSGATKNLVLGKKNLSIRKTRCFTPLSMTSRSIAEEDYPGNAV